MKRNGPLTRHETILADRYVFNDGTTYTDVIRGCHNLARAQWAIGEAIARAALKHPTR